MRTSLLLLLALVVGCAPARPTAAPEAAVHQGADPGVIVPQDDDEGPPRPDDPEARKRHMAERFPGVDEIELVKVTAWAEPRSGMCWSRLTPVHQVDVSVEYSTGWFGSSRRLSGLEDLLEAGWTKIYRAPQGEGFERRGGFRAIDLTYETELTCLCAPEAKAIAGDRQRLKLRLRWRKGATPEIGATASRDGRAKPLIGSVTAGHLPVYEFAVAGAFPEGRKGSCGAHLALALLIDPPIL